ncbi:PIG-L family deacetylase [Roseinatronobacter alkalisoli]|uniref:PIG-L family deacetylase n=1 Tax=Roseinatronobacter alkalisoli TaxID=3028235 RepID=A0ABT5TFA3_9RHOB|nr:PIG-L family deacetylase [Roseinatronobacter sp. HJB301]MDD7973051.1 PIG-L family deacetylase [Roseinatronobacter sp. HJB301]
MNDRDKLALDRLEPPALLLHRALSRLTGLGCVMQTGAHPDDEQNAMLACLRFEHGAQVVIACSTRGEGGQNALGPERGGALGVIRTAEMHAAAATIDADVAWLGFGPNDPVHDFGFSRDGQDTLARWGKQLIIDRLASAYRVWRPDVVIPTFLDVPGQHGHHRAMTEAAEAALTRATDPSFDDGNSPWQVARYLLPAWSGGGATYDDETPPPPTTHRVRIRGNDPATGASFARIGEWSRAAHASQGMGRLATAGTEWPLHLKAGPDGAEILSDLPRRLCDIDGLPRDCAQAVDHAVERALAAWPDSAAVLAALETMLAPLAVAFDHCPPEHQHRLNRFRDNLHSAILAAACPGLRVWSDSALLTPGTHTALKTDAAHGAERVVLHAEFGAGLRFADGRVDIASDAQPDNVWTAHWFARGGNGHHMRAELDLSGHRISAPVDICPPLRIIPHGLPQTSPDAMLLINTSRASLHPDAAAQIQLPPGWRIDASDNAAPLLVAPDDVAETPVTLALQMGQEPGYHMTPITMQQLPPMAHVVPAAIRVLPLRLTLPAGAKIGHIDGGADRTALWLHRMGLPVTTLAPAMLDKALPELTTVTVGTLAFGTRPEWRACLARLHGWVRAGGHLVTFYHRPTDNWDPGHTPPLPLTIGSPSLRWRTTDPAAPITVLAPDHPLLNAPNRITAQDWSGWHKERGLYFASDWDPAYCPVVETGDVTAPGLRGALLSARVGKGRHTHCAFVLHHQMDCLVPGAFRLMANLVAPAA